MKVIKAKYEIITKINPAEILLELERFGRVSHLSEPKLDGDPIENACSFIKKFAIDANHATILEACDLTIEFTIDRGVTHEGVRHRLTSPMQESTRYCNYSKEKYDNEITIIDISQHLKNPDVSLEIWMNAMQNAENSYFAMLAAGELPEIARSVLPNSLKSKLNIKANLREWRDIFTKRTHKAAHPQMREVMRPLLDELKSKIPVIFDDITY